MFEINVENITFNYGKQKVLEDINFKAERGDFICILGLPAVARVLSCVWLQVLILQVREQYPLMEKA